MLNVDTVLKARQANECVEMGDSFDETQYVVSGKMLRPSV